MGESIRSSRMRDIVEHYHHCASCRHFGFRQEGEKNIPFCTRLGYDTKPKFQFDCWDPKERVRKQLQLRLIHKDVD